MLSILSEAAFVTPPEINKIRGQPAYLKIDLSKLKSPTESEIHKTRGKKMH